MTDQKVKCPLCQEKFSYMRLGCHLLSKKHRDKLLSSDNRKWLTNSLAKIDANKLSQDQRVPPLFKFKDSEQHICLVCKKTYSASNLEVKKHFTKYEECAKQTPDAIRKMLTPPVKADTSADTTELLKQIKELKEQLELQEDDSREELNVWKARTYKLSGLGSDYFSHQNNFDDCLEEETEYRSEYRSFKDQFPGHFN